MVVCYKFLFRQKKQNQTDMDKLSRRMSFKLPIALRYSVGLSFFFGIIHLTFSRSMKYFKHHVLAMPIYMMAFCHQEIYHFYCIQTGKPVKWRVRGKNLYDEQMKQKQRLKEIDDQMKLTAKTLTEQLDKPINAQL